MDEETRRLRRILDHIMKFDDDNNEDISHLRPHRCKLMYMSRKGTHIKVLTKCYKQCTNHKEVDENDVQQENDCGCDNCHLRVQVPKHPYYDRDYWNGDAPGTYVMYRIPEFCAALCLEMRQILYLDPEYPSNPHDYDPEKADDPRPEYKPQLRDVMTRIEALCFNKM
jgi:hypothetical protein